MYIYISSLIIYKNDEISHTGMVDARFPSEKSPSFFHLLPQASWASNLVWVSQHLERLETTKWRHCFGVKDIYIYIYFFFKEPSSFVRFLMIQKILLFGGMFDLRQGQENHGASWMILRWGCSP